MQLLRDLRYGLRVLMRSPGFSAITVGTLALGIGAATAIFSVVNGVLLRSLPFPEPDSIVVVFQVDDNGRQMGFSDPNFSDFAARNRSLKHITQYSVGMVSITGGDEPVRALRSIVSREFFDTLGVRPMLGRTFHSEELHQGAAPVAVISQAFWQRNFQGDPDSLTRTLTISNEAHHIVGIMPAGFGFPSGVDIWTPREQRPVLPSRTAHNWRVIGRLGDSVTLEDSRQELSLLARHLKEQHGEDTWMADAHVERLHDRVVGEVRPALMVLFGAVGFLLLVACANVVNLLLSHASSRRREIAVRSALGAGRLSLVRMFLVESLLLTGAGAILGVLVASAGLNALLAIEPGNIPGHADIRLDYGVLVFAAGLSVITALTLGVISAWKITGENPREYLSSGARGSRASGSGTRRMLVAGQLAITLVLMAGASLLGRSLYLLLSVDPGFRTANLIAMDLQHPPTTHEQAKARLSHFHEELIGRLSSIPGVIEVGAINAFPMWGNQANGQFLILEPHEADSVTSMSDFGRLGRDPARRGYAEFRVADEGYFRAMGIRLVRGRLFDQRDSFTGSHVAVISESLASQRWPGEDPIGKLIQYGNMDGYLNLLTIVGIVSDVREYGLESDTRPVFYGHYVQRPVSSVTFAIHADGDQASIISSARAVLRELDPSIPPRLRTIEDILAASTAGRRFNLVLLGVFAGLALLLAIMGVYGVTAHAVQQRTREIGIRMAMGARQVDILRMILGGGLILTGIGVAVGLAGALGLARVLRTMLWGVPPHDPAAFATVSAVLAAVSFLAAYIPARRAARVDPNEALRVE